MRIHETPQINIKKSQLDQGDLRSYLNAIPGCQSTKLDRKCWKFKKNIEPS